MVIYIFKTDFRFFFNYKIIQGMELLMSRFNMLITSFKKKPYDCLDQRKNDFEVDYIEFKRSVQEIYVIFYS